MENSSAGQLPGVDSLPDGFVESSMEPLAPTTPALESEKPLHGYRDSQSLQQDCLNNSVNVLVENESMLNGMKPENEKKLRTFPVPLFEKDGYDASGESADVSDDGCFEHASVRCQSYSHSSETSGEPVKRSSLDAEKVKDHSDSKRTEESCCGGSHAPAELAKEAPSSSDYLKNKKEVPEVKRKSSKRTFKTEKEFLEFTLRYQQVLAERDAAIAVRDKLESLCRELQRQNKLLMDECKRVSEEGQNLRLDLSNKFHDAIKDVSNRLEEQKGDYLSQLKENEMLREKLKELADQFTLSEQQHSQQLKQKSLELQIAELKIQQHEEKSAQEQAQMKVYAEQVSQLLATEKSLRLQLTADGDKFQQFQDALQKSNEVFETFKLEIEKMAKSIKELRKENAFLKSKSEKSDITLIELVEERELLKKQLEKTKNQKEKLESLCRSLQAERKLGSNVTSGTGPAISQP